MHKQMLRSLSGLMLVAMVLLTLAAGPLAGQIGNGGFFNADDEETKTAPAAQTPTVASVPVGTTVTGDNGIVITTSSRDGITLGTKIADFFNNLFVVVSSIWKSLAQIFQGILVGDFGKDGSTTLGDTGTSTGTSTGTTTGTTTGTSTGTTTTSGTTTGTDNASGTILGVKISGKPTEFTSSQKAELQTVLGAMPESYRTTCKEITRDGTSAARGCLGFVQPPIPTVHIAANCPQRDFAGTVVHEMAHTFQIAHPDVEAAWRSQFWSGNRVKSRSVSSYGNTKYYEDMAESVRVYYENPAKMKRYYPDRYEFVKSRIMGGKEF